MSEYLAHAAVYDDARRVALRDDRYPDAFHTALREHAGYGRAGSITRSMFYHVVPLVDRVRAEWSPGNESAAQRLAFALGWISHRAADRHIKAMALVTDPDFYEPDEDRVGISLPRIWHDLVLYDRVYDGGRSGVMPRHLFSRDAGDHPAASTFAVAALEPVAQAEWAGELATLHNGFDGGADLSERLDALLEARPEYYVPLDDYADRIERPFPEEEQRFVRTAHFYDADDPLIALARTDLEDEAPGPVAQARAAVGPSSSQYAVILERSMAYFDATAAYWRGEISTDAVRDALDFNTWARGPEATAASRALLDGYAR